MYIYNDSPSFSDGGRTQNVSYMVQGVFKEALESVYILKVSWRPWGRAATNFTFAEGVGQNMYLTFWYGPPPRRPDQ